VAGPEIRRADARRRADAALARIRRAGKFVARTYLAGVANRAGEDAVQAIG
jgi:hypothetical protein